MPDDPSGIASIESPYPFDETMARLKTAIAGKGLILFAEIDHAAGARQAGLQMRESRVLIFGHPKAGTPLMMLRPLLALDLPLKALVWQNDAGKAVVSYSTAAYLAQRYAIPPELVKNIAGVENLVREALAGPAE